LKEICVFENCRGQKPYWQPVCPNLCLGVIKGYQAVQPLEPKGGGAFQWPAAFGAGVIAGAVLLFVPRGSPWSTMTFFSPVVMGRNLSLIGAPPIGAAWLLHFVVAIVYGLIISRVVTHMQYKRAFVTGALLGLALYCLNLAIVSLGWPQLRGAELTVVFTHIVFGLIAAGAYRGLLRRQVVA
jgi:hypothetical protein